MGIISMPSLLSHKFFPGYYLDTHFGNQNIYRKTCNNHKKKLLVWVRQSFLDLRRKEWSTGGQINWILSKFKTPALKRTLLREGKEPQTGRKYLEIIPDKGFVLRIYQERLKFTNKGLDSALPLQGPQVQSSVRELRSHKPCGTAKKQPNKKMHKPYEQTILQRR